MFICERCGCAMKEDTAQQRLRRGRGLWGCQECQAGQQFKVRTSFGICTPHQGELDERDRPLDKKGRLFREGVRLCGYSDCIDLDHIDLVPEPIVQLKPIAPAGHKVCTKCVEVKPMLAFGIDRKKRDGRNCECLICRRNKPSQKKRRISA